MRNRFDGESHNHERCEVDRSCVVEMLTKYLDIMWTFHILEYLGCFILLSSQSLCFCVIAYCLFGKPSQDVS